MFQRILIPIDSSPCSKTAAHLAARLARAWGSQLSFAHVYTSPPSQEMKSLLEQFGQYARQVPHLILEPLQQSLADTLVNLASREQAELILIGTHAHAKLERQAIGSVAHDVAVLAHIPVLVVPAETKKVGFEARWAQAFLGQQAVNLSDPLSIVLGDQPSMSLGNQPSMTFGKEHL